MKRLLLAILGVISAHTAHSQEIRCTQIFMNESEKAICASTEIMARDTKMSTLAHRVKLVDQNYDHDQKRFRSELKACKGSADCINSKYDERISYLELKLSNSSPLTSEQEAVAVEKDADAQKKLERQASSRQKYASQAASVQEQEQRPPVEQETADDQSTQPTPQNVTPSETVQIESQAIQSVEPSEEISPKAGASAKTSKESDWLIVAVGSVILLSILWSIWTWFKHAVRRCPKCTKWWGNELASTSNSSTEYEMRDVDDIHKDRHGIERGRTTRKQQIAVNVTNTSTRYRCSACKNEWTIHSTSKS